VVLRLATAAEISDLALSCIPEDAPIAESGATADRAGRFRPPAQIIQICEPSS